MPLQDEYLFVSNMTENGFNQFYIMLVDANRSFARSSGMPIHHCPWCGDQIRGKKKYPTKDLD